MNLCLVVSGRVGVSGDVLWSFLVLVSFGIFFSPTRRVPLKIPYWTGGHELLYTLPVRENLSLSFSPE